MLPNGVPYQPSIGYRRVADRVAVDLSRWRLWKSDKTDFKNHELLQLFEQNSLKYRKVEIEAKPKVNTLSYLADKLIKQADPDNFNNCSEFTAYLYGRIGIELPLTALQQHQFGVAVPFAILDMMFLETGDLVFSRGHHSIYDSCDNNDIGHVGIVTTEGAVVHMTKEKGVMETPLKRFIERRSYRGVCRIVENFSALYTVFIPQALREKIIGSECLKYYLARKI